MTYAQLPTLKTLLKYPVGWTFKSKTLDKDLTVQAFNGSARIIWDERVQSWDSLDPGWQITSHRKDFPFFYDNPLFDAFHLELLPVEGVRKKE